MVFKKRKEVANLHDKYVSTSTFELERLYKNYLMNNENINLGFKLGEDAIIFTDKRLIFTENSNAGENGISLMSVNLFSIIQATIEVGEINEVDFSYIDSTYLKEQTPDYENYTLEFQNKNDAQNVYKILQEIAYTNCLTINNIK